MWYKIKAFFVKASKTQVSYLKFTFWAILTMVIPLGICGIYMVISGSTSILEFFKWFGFVVLLAFITIVYVPNASSPGSTAIDKELYDEISAKNPKLAKIIATILLVGALGLLAYLAYKSLRGEGN